MNNETKERRIGGEKEEKKEGKKEELSFNPWLKNCHTQGTDI